METVYDYMVGSLDYVESLNDGSAENSLVEKVGG